MFASCKQVEALKGKCLFKADEKPDYMFFVVSGEVVLERPGLQGTHVILQHTRKDFVSEASLKSAKYHYNGQVAADAEVVQIPIR